MTTVKALIRELSRYPEDTKVVQADRSHGGGGYLPAGVYKVEDGVITIVGAYKSL